jgi:endonuclease/exonuclease/phosphatase family metal-dependent hydrolase
MKVIISLRLFFVLTLFCASSSYSQSVKLMTYNIKYDNRADTINSWELRREKLVDLVLHYAPDFLGTQEGLAHQVSYLDKELYDYEFVGVGRDDGIKKGEFAAIFYKKESYEILKSGTFWLSETPATPSVGWDASMERICTWGLFANLSTNKKILIFNTHFDHIGSEARAESAKLILQKITEFNTSGLPLVLLGDLNLTPDTSPIKEISTQLNDAFHVAENPFYGPIGTFNGFRNLPVLNRIDYVFVQGLRIRSLQHIDNRLDSGLQISDHFPVFAIAYHK